MKRWVVDVVHQPWSSDVSLDRANGASCVTLEGRLFWGRQVPHRDEGNAVTYQQNCGQQAAPELSDVVRPEALYPDYRLANRLCSATHAESFLQQGHEPKADDLLHLIELIGQTQYPKAAPEEFWEVEAEHHLPRVDHLTQCRSLVIDFYLRHLPAMKLADGPRGGIYEDNMTPLERLYRVARGAVRNEVWNKPTHSVDPQLTVSAVAAVLATQPPSFEQYCLWAEDLDSWVHMSREQHPELAASMRALPRAWATAKALPKPASDTCRVRLPPYVGLDEGSAWLRRFNADLKRFGLPCQARAKRPNPVSWVNPPDLICRIATAPVSK